jgi:hypothetical protein
MDFNLLLPFFGVLPRRASLPTFFLAFHIVFQPLFVSDHCLTSKDGGRGALAGAMAPPKFPKKNKINKGGKKI